MSCEVDRCSTLSFYMWIFSFSSIILSLLNYLGILVKNQLTMCCFWTLSSILLFYVSILMPVSQYLEVSFEIRKCESSNFILLFQNCFDHSGSFAFPYTFQKQLVIFYKEDSWNVHKNCTESIDQFVECCYLNSKRSNP